MHVSFPVRSSQTSSSPTGDWRRFPPFDFGREQQRDIWGSESRSSSQKRSVLDGAKIPHKVRADDPFSIRTRGAKVVKHSVKYVAIENRSSLALYRFGLHLKNRRFHRRVTLETRQISSPRSPMIKIRLWNRTPVKKEHLDTIVQKKKYRWIAPCRDHFDKSLSRVFHLKFSLSFYVFRLFKPFLLHISMYLELSSCH